MNPKVQPNSRATRTNGGIPLRNVWLLMLYASDLFRMRGTDLLDAEEMPDDLPDVIAELLAYAVEERLRRNLPRAYQPRTAVLDRVRGAIDVLGTESRQLIRQGKVACRYEDLTIDTLRNRYVRGALESIARQVSTLPLAHRCRALARHLRSMGVGERVPSTREASADRFGRHDADDRFMIAVARLAFDLALPTETRGEQLLGRADRDVHWLRKLFERAVYGFYKVTLSPEDWSVSHGRVLHWPLQARTPGLAAILPRMETDIELFHKHTSRKIVIDTKFTSLLKPAQFRDTLRSGYLYQIYAYLRSQVDVPPPTRLTEGVLLHPTTEHTIDEAAKIQGHVLRFTTVNLAGPPSGLRTGLLRIVDEPILSH
ncbi:MAG: 5-methylcytosine-specific restriction endonuclease system specificity protein McrC [Rhodospirillaceae bacterium]|nr:5-methylcytosine-specific restriction endonuclease system specificity protein McrC [Rhodospirillaceae bacterium]